MQAVDLVRELKKYQEAIQASLSYLKKQNEANALLHLSNEVLHSPLTTKMGVALLGISGLIDRLEDEID